MNNIRISLHNFIDWLYVYSGVISTVLIIILSIIDISNVNEAKISKWGLIDFPIGKVFYYIICGTNSFL